MSVEKSKDALCEMIRDALGYEGEPIARLSEIVSWVLQGYCDMINANHDDVTKSDETACEAMRFAVRRLEARGL